MTGKGKRTTRRISREEEELMSGEVLNSVKLSKTLNKHYVQRTLPQVPRAKYVVDYVVHNGNDEQEITRTPSADYTSRSCPELNSMKRILPIPPVLQILGLSALGHSME